MTTLATIEGCRERAIADATVKANKEAAKDALPVLRSMLVKHNLRRHNVKVSSGMGSVCLTVNGKVWPPDGRFDHRMDSVLCTLQLVAASLNYEWADYINGKSLTHFLGSANNL